MVHLQCNRADARLQPWRRGLGEALALHEDFRLMHVFLLKLGRGLNGPAHLHGALFIADHALYFWCTHVGRLDFSKLTELGPIGLALEDYKKTGRPPTIDENELRALVAATPNSIVLAPENIELVSKSMWSGSKIIHDGGKKLVVWNPGFAGTLREQMRAWAQRHGVKTKGL